MEKWFLRNLQRFPSEGITQGGPQEWQGPKQGIPMEPPLTKWPWQEECLWCCRNRTNRLWNVGWRNFQQCLFLLSHPPHLQWQASWWHQNSLPSCFFVDVQRGKVRIVGPIFSNPFPIDPLHVHSKKRCSPSSVCVQHIHECLSLVYLFSRKLNCSSLSCVMIFLMGWYLHIEWSLLWFQFFALSAVECAASGG